MLNPPTMTPKKSAATTPAVNNGPHQMEIIDMIYWWPAECLIETSQPRIWFIKRAKILTPGNSRSFGSRATIGAANDKKRSYGRLPARGRGLVPVSTCSSLGNLIGVTERISAMRFSFTQICIMFSMLLNTHVARSMGVPFPMFFFVFSISLCTPSLVLRGVTLCCVEVF